MPQQAHSTTAASAADAAPPPIVPTDDMLLRQRLEEARMTLVGALQVRSAD